MSSIYNTSRLDKGKARTPVPRRVGAPLRPGVVPQRVLQQRQFQQQQQQQQQQQAADITFNEFHLMSVAKRGQHHLMDFKTNKAIDPKNFARPVKLHRKETNFVPYRQYIQNLNAQNAAKAAKAAAAAANAAAIMAGNLPTQTEELNEVPTPTHHGPKTGADTSLIAPLGGATRNKQMLFKKRTKQIYLAKEDTREIKEQEHRPWILEDYDGQNSFTGTYEGGQRSAYVFFVLTESGFKVVPVDKWYKFQPKRNFKTLSLEEAEEQLKKQQKRENGRWMMLKRESENSNSEADANPSRKFKIVDTGDNNRGGSDDEGGRQDSDMDDLDFDDVFQDDEEGTGEHELEDEDVRDSKDRIKKEIKDYSITGGQQDDVDEFEDNNKLTSEGKQLRKLVRDLEKNRAYESDDDEDPYASSADEVESDQNDEEQNEENEKEKKNNMMPPKKKATATVKPNIPKKMTKIKKEELSKPISRPGSPSFQIKKEGSISPNRPSSPVNTTSQMRPRSPSLASPSSPHKDINKKRKMEEISGGSMTDSNKHKKTTTSTTSSDEAGLITEQEVINTLRGKIMTTKEFLMSFRKRIKKDPRNRDIITTLLRKVAKSNRSSDPNTRTLELKPEFQ
ncbi:uncharacterized protein BX663DRAFT_473038 [Cokeromyces recurvatus]|uniref:uncharacterized protein n=1 Tax=Cokeromyces recurvatus TaxID=90255 RepID=UPI00221F795C|nr:uncharacterized protein BX663DRAFT_473038 [Cokeromyces recurvatus]KAI7902644.1 hypothetical protein BX663DRAFT_473038 [Cokeromyces recurvatus]